MEEKKSEMDFQKKLEDALAQIDLDLSSYDEKETESYAEAYAHVEAYVFQRELLSASVALPLVRWIMCDASKQADVQRRSEEKYRYIPYVQHCLAVCTMLIDLHIPLSHHEEDCMLAAAICHILPENPTIVTFKNMHEKLTQEFHMCEEIAQIVRLITREDGMTHEEQGAFYEHLKQNKLAVLIRLADRSNLVQQLYGISTLSAKEYIYETREHFFPLCIYAKENYPELLGPIGVMMEKMRCHIEVSEIMIKRYEEREQQMMKEILFLQEENSRMRILIRNFQDIQES